MISLKDVILEKGNGFGVAFRASQIDAFNGYTFQYDPGYGGGAFIMRKWANGREFAPFARQPAPSFDWYGASHDIEIVVRGDTYSAYVDNVLVLEGRDSTWVDNDQAAGLRVWDSSEVSLGDFQVDPLE